MAQIQVNGNGIKRSICLNFDINTAISYKDFCKNKDYQSQIEIIDNHFVLEDGYHFIGNFFRVGIVLNISTILGIDLAIQNHGFQKLVSHLFQFDVKESFQNLSKEKIDEVQKIIDDRNSFFNEDAIEIIQAILSARDQEDVLLFGNDLIMSTIFQGDGIISKILEKIENVEYTVDNIQNKRLYYTIFQILIQKESVFFVYNGGGNFLVCSADCLCKNVDSASVVYNLTTFLYENIPLEIKENIQILKEKYGSNDLMSIYFKEITKQFETVKNIEIKTLSKEFDTNKRGEIDKNLPNADIGFKKHKGEKKYIKIERTFKLKKK